MEPFDVALYDDITELVFDDYLRLNRRFSHTVYQNMERAYPNQPIIPDGFERVLDLLWLGYCRTN